MNMKFKLLFSIAIFVLMTGLVHAYEASYDLSKEHIGKLFYGMTDSEVKKVQGKPTSLAKAEFMGASGEWEQDWQYQASGLRLTLCATRLNGPAKLCRISVEAPSTLATSRGIRIGSTAAEVQKAYQKEINEEESKQFSQETATLIVVGSYFGGLMFTIENDKVSEIFIGAAAE